MKLVTEMMREFHQGGVSGDCVNMRRLAERASCYRIRGYAGHAESYADLSFDDIVRLHDDDLILGSKMMIATGVIEMFMRMKWAHCIEENHGKSGHRKKKLYREGTVRIKGRYVTRHEFLIRAITETGAEHMPVQQLAENISFGLLSKFIGNLHGSIVKQIGSDFDAIGGKLPSILRSITEIRNKCAHFGRLWNAHYSALGTLQPRGLLANAIVGKGDAPGSYNPLALLACMTDIIQPELGWKHDVIAFIEKSSFASKIEHMGFPSDWRKRDVWKP